MATLESRLESLATDLGADTKAILLAIGNLTALQTNAKTSLVNALNEVLASVGNGSGVVIDDGAPAVNKVFSSQAVTDKIQAAISGIIGADIDAAYDTLKELEAFIKANGTAAANLLTAVAKKVDFTVDQTLTTQEKTRARANIGAYGAAEIGNPDVNLVAIYTAAKNAV